MSMSLPNALATVLVGIVATAVLDAWAVTLHRTLGLPMTNWGHVGRWVVGLRSGRLRLTSSDITPAVAWERAVGWSTHYVIGVIYAAAYLVMIASLSRTPSISTAVAFGAGARLPELGMFGCRAGARSRHREAAAR